MLIGEAAFSSMTNRYPYSGQRLHARRAFGGAWRRHAPRDETLRISLGTAT